MSAPEFVGSVSSMMRTTLTRALFAALLAGCTASAPPETSPATTPPAPPAPTGPLPPGAQALAALVKDHGLTYEDTPGYVAVDIPASDRWAHTYAIRSTTRDVEIRFGLAPAAVDEQLAIACGADKVCAAQPPRAALAEILASAVKQLAAPGTTPRTKEFPFHAVRREFNANWGGAVGFDVDPAFSAVKHGLAIVIHHEGRPSAMFVTLYAENSEADEDERMRAFHALRFAAPPPAPPADTGELPGTRWYCGGNFVYLDFTAEKLVRTVLSAAMLVMGDRVPYETEYDDIKYLPGDRISLVPTRIDNLEMGDRTPKNPTPQIYTARRRGDELIFGAEDWKEQWTCSLESR